MKKIYSAVLAATLAVGMQSAYAAGNLVVNGGFESNAVVNAGGVDTFAYGSSGLTGWTIGVGNVDLVSSAYWAPYQGNNSLDLNGTRKGEIHQVLNTVAGQQYQLSFWLSGNPLGGDIIKNMSVNVGSNGLYQFDTTGKTTSNMGWTQYVTSFFAVGNTTTLSFASNTGRGSSYWGPALDNISVTAVPEPETYGMLLAGLGLMGLALRRRKNQA